jgi:hypothetical protein
MKSQARQTSLSALALILSLLIAPHLFAQSPTASLSGKVIDGSSKAVANARVTAKNLESNESTEARTSADGTYTFSRLAPGDYEVSVSIETLGSKTAKVTLAAGEPQTLDLALAQEPLPNAPSLGDLGFTPQQSQPDAKLQALLEKRTEMLKMHQRLGLIAAAPMAAALITGPMAKAKGRNGQTITEPTTANLDFHAALGGATTALYFSSAYFSIFAPKVPGTTKHGAIRMHEALAFVHVPGMFITPALGIMAYKQENAGEKVHGLASAHGTVAWVTAAAYGTSIVAVSWPIHWKFWEK